MTTTADPLPNSMSKTLPQRWRHTLPALFLLLAWILFLYRDTAVSMVSIWYRSETFTHGFLVLPISLWLIWRQRHSIAARTPQPMAILLPLVAFSAFIWLLADLVAVNAVTQLAFVALLVLSVPTVLGRVAAAPMIFPLGFLFFAVPIGEFLLPQLMDWTADFTVLALRLSGVPVYREGLTFVIPSGNWSVVEACSGVRYLIASLTVGTLFAYLNYRSLKRRILFVLVAIAVPIVANWLRAYMIVMLGHLSGNKIAVGVDHLIYGWVFFGIVIMLMFAIGARWSEPEKEHGVGQAVVLQSERVQSFAPLWIVTASLALLVALPHVVQWSLERTANTDPVSLVLPQDLSDGWTSARPGEVDFQPSFQNPSAQVNGSYASRGSTVGLYLGVYKNQHYGSKLVSSSNVLVTSQDPKWTQISSGSYLATVEEKQLAVRSAQLSRSFRLGQSSDGALTVWQIYWIHGALTASDPIAKLRGAMDRLLGRPDSSAVIVVYALNGQPESAEVVLQRFLSANYETINALLMNTR